MSGGPPLVSGLVRTGGLALGAVFGITAVLRRTKPLHPEGVVGRGELVVAPGTPRSGVPLLDTAGRRDCVVRASYAMGSGPRLPDIEGFALRVVAPGGDAVEDVLFASTGSGRLSRHLLLPRSPGRHATQTTLLPVRAGGRPLLLRLDPADPTTQPWPTAYDLFWAQGRGEWHRWGRLTVSWGEAVDAPGRFDPIRHPLRGTTQYAVVTRLREPAYRISRRACASAGTLETPRVPTRTDGSRSGSGEPVRDGLAQH